MATHRGKGCLADNVSFSWPPPITWLLLPLLREGLGWASPADLQCDVNFYTYLETKVQCAMCARIEVNLSRLLAVVALEAMKTAKHNLICIHVGCLLILIFGHYRLILMFGFKNITCRPTKTSSATLARPGLICEFSFSNESLCTQIKPGTTRFDL